MSRSRSPASIPKNKKRYLDGECRGPRHPFGWDWRVIATLVAIWFKISTVLSEIVAGTVAYLFRSLMAKRLAGMMGEQLRSILVALSFAVVRLVERTLCQIQRKFDAYANNYGQNWHVSSGMARSRPTMKARSGPIW